jgi:ABC-type transport system involved in cytochrome c biogenesis permease subunit
MAGLGSWAVNFSELVPFIVSVHLLCILHAYILFLGLQEYEKKMVPWLYCFAVFTLFRLFAFVFGSIVNDMIFGYNIAMCLLWILYTVASVYGWLLVYSLYLELSDLTKLEDLAHLRVRNVDPPLLISV